jgi:c-di-GMP-binding flagellar brake protein YcgR
MKEKRKFVRLKAPIGLLYRRVSKLRRHRQTQSLVRDLSIAGVRFGVKEDLRHGDLVEVDIQIPHLVEPVHAVGEVVWFSRAEAARGGNEAALRFRDIEPADLNHILEYVHTIGIG